MVILLIIIFIFRCRFYSCSNIVIKNIADDKINDKSANDVTRKNSAQDNTNESDSLATENNLLFEIYEVLIDQKKLIETGVNLYTTSANNLPSKNEFESLKNEINNGDEIKNKINQKDENQENENKENKENESFNGEKESKINKNQDTLIG